MGPRIAGLMGLSGLLFPAGDADYPEGYCAREVARIQRELELFSAIGRKRTQLFFKGKLVETEGLKSY